MQTRQFTIFSSSNTTSAISALAHTDEIILPHFIELTIFFNGVTCLADMSFILHSKSKPRAKWAFHTWILTDFKAYATAKNKHTKRRETHLSLSEPAAWYICSFSVATPQCFAGVLYACWLTALCACVLLLLLLLFLLSAEISLYHFSIYIISFLSESVIQLSLNSWNIHAKWNNLVFSTVKLEAVGWFVFSLIVTIWNENLVRTLVAFK